MGMQVAAPNVRADHAQMYPTTVDQITKTVTKVAWGVWESLPNPATVCRCIVGIVSVISATTVVAYGPMAHEHYSSPYNPASDVALHISSFATGSAFGDPLVPMSCKDFQDGMASLGHPDPDSMNTSHLVPAVMMGPSLSTLLPKKGQLAMHPAASNAYGLDGEFNDTIARTLYFRNASQESIVWSRSGISDIVSRNFDASLKSPRCPISRFSGALGVFMSRSPEMVKQIGEGEFGAAFDIFNFGDYNTRRMEEADLIRMHTNPFATMLKIKEAVLNPDSTVLHGSRKYLKGRWEPKMWIGFSGPKRPFPGDYTVYLDSEVNVLHKPTSKNRREYLKTETIISVSDYFGRVYSDQSVLFELRHHNGKIYGDPIRTISEARLAYLRKQYEIEKHNLDDLSIVDLKGMITKAHEAGSTLAKTFPDTWKS